MRTRYVDLVAGTGDSCRGDGEGRAIHSRSGSGGIFRVPVTAMALIYYQNPNANYGGLVQQKLCFATGYLCMGLLYADLSAYNGMTVIAATINIEKTAAHPAKDFTCYEVFTTWIENEVTYNDKTTGVPWQVAGCEGALDRKAVADDVLSVAAAGFHAWDVSTMVTAWLSSTRVNYGMRIWPEINTAAIEEWYTDDNVTPAKNPYFELTLA